MAMENILVAYDGSDSSVKALDLVATIVKGNPDANIDIANVVAIPLLTEEQIAAFSSVLEMMEKDGADLLDEALAKLDELGVENAIQTMLVRGVDPAAELAKLIEHEGYDLVVIGSRGLTGVKGYLGSVSHKVLANAKVPVLIVK